jgi:hypothetical protein
MPERPPALERARIAFELWNDEGLEAMAAQFWHPDVAENLILIEAIIRGRGTTSGAPGEVREFFLIETDEAGLTTRFREFLDGDAARAALRALTE